MESPNKSLQSIMKQIAEAQNLDSGDNVKNAYIKYLQSTQFIAEHLLVMVQNTSDFIFDVSTKRLINLASMCIQRAEDIINKKLGQRPNVVSSFTPSQPSNLPGSMILPLTPSSQPLVGSPLVSAVGSLPTIPSGPPGIGASQPVTSPGQASLPVSYRSMTVDIRSPHEPSPLEIAERKNRQLMAAYRSRITGLTSKTRYKATDLNLGLQRKLAENLALAKAREEVLAKKRAERRKRLEELATKRFTSTLGMSEDEQERRQIYTRILEYEQDNKWLLPWREKLQEKPEDAELIQQLVVQILKTPSHPLTQLMYSYQHKVYNKIHPLLEQWHTAVHNTKKESHEDTQHTQEQILSPTPSPSHQPSVQRTSSQASKISQYSPALYDASDFDDLFDDDLNGSANDLDKPSSFKSSEGYGSLKDSNIPLEHSSSGLNSLNIASGESPVNLSVINIANSESKEGNGTTQEQSEISNTRDLAPEEPEHEIFGSDSLKSQCNRTNDLSSKDLSPNPATQPSSILDTPERPSSPTPDALLELQREALLRHAGSVSQDVQDYLEKVTTMFIIAYEGLDHATGRDSCYSGLEEPFYRPIWAHILALFRAIYHREEASLAAVMSNHAQCDPDFLRIPRSLCLRPEDCLLMPEGYEPYRAAVDDLRAIEPTVSPLAKLECIVQVSRSLCKCVEDFYKNNNADPPHIGADDLLPILSFVVIKSNQPQILAECRVLEELVHEGYLMGEEGYCLTSLETAVQYVASLE